MHPLIPNFGPIVIPIPIPGTEQALKIHGFGILVATGMLVGTWVGQRKCIRDGLDPEIPNRLLGWVVAGVFIGGHLGHVLFYEPHYYLQHPAEVLKVWNGLSSFGGFIACAFLVYYFIKKFKLELWPWADITFYALAVGWAFGRMGCFSAHDHPGLETNFWLGVYGICPSGDPFTACHDLGFYESLFTWCMVGLFVYLDRKPRFPGMFIGLMLTAYGPVRFCLDMLRHPDRDVRYFGFTPAQYGSVILFFIGIWILKRQWGKTPYRLRAKQDTSAIPAEG